MNILGISAFYHDSAAAQKGKNAFTRKKHDAGFPPADRLLPARGGPDADQLDYVAFYDKPLHQVRAPAGDVLWLTPERLPELLHGHARVAQGEAVHAPR